MQLPLHSEREKATTKDFSKEGPRQLIKTKVLDLVSFQATYTKVRSGPFACN